LYSWPLTCGPCCPSDAAVRDEGAALLGADTPAYPKGHLSLRKRNQSISLTRTIARMRVQKDEGAKEESEGVQHTAGP
jgi:hypothetical protein